MKTNANLHITNSPVRAAWMVRVISLIITSWVASLLPAAQLTLQHNVTRTAAGGYYQGVADSWNEYDNQKNYGGSPTLYIGMRSDGVGDSGIIKFDLPAVTCQSITGATLWLWYADTYGINYNNTAIKLVPFRIKPDKPWDENNKQGESGYGVNFQNRLANNTGPWTSGMGGFYDSIDDGNGCAWIRKAGGSVTNAYEPQNWVPFDVRPSVTNWYAGITNNGWGIYWQGNVGSDSTGDGIFGARDDTLYIYGPKLVITYAGAQISWGGYTNAVWDTNTVNWNVGGYRGTYGNGDFVTFADGASNTGISVASAWVSPGSVTISNSATTYSFSGGSIGGSGGLTKRGTGQATLSASNSYAGLTLVEAGRLIVSANNALGGIGTGTTVSSGAALGLQNVAYTAAEPLAIAGAGVSGSGALYAASGNNSYGGLVSLVGHSTIGVGSGMSLTLTNTVAGGYSLTKNGAGTLFFAGSLPNTYSGDTYVNQGTLALAKSAGNAVPGALFIGDGSSPATVRLDNHGQLGNGNVTVRTGSQLNLNNFNSRITGDLVLSNASVVTGTGTLTLGGGVSTAGDQTNSISGRLDLDGAVQAFGVGDGAAVDDLVVSAAVTNGGIFKLGPGRLVLSGNNTFDGNVMVSEGQLAVASSTALGSTAGGTIVSSGARLELRGGIAVGAETLTLNGIGAGFGALRSVSGNNSWAGQITLGSAATVGADPAGALTLSGPIDAAGFDLSVFAGGNVSLLGAIGGAGSGVTKTGPGTLTLGGSSANTYTGPTTVDLGQLILAKGGAAAIPGQLTVGTLLSTASVLCQGNGQFAPGATATIQPGSLLNLNGFNGRLVGLTLLDSAVETGTGTLQLAGPLACVGSTTATINGNLRFMGIQDINVKVGTTLNVGAAVSGDGFNKLGAGLLVLLNTNTLNGQCWIGEGKVLVNNDGALGFGLGPGPVQVERRATLGGTGSICGPVTVVEGTLSPGASLGTLTISNNVGLGPGSQLQIEVGGPAPAIDLLDLRQGGTFDIGPDVFLRLQGALEGTRPYIFVRGAQNVTGTFMDLPEGAEVPGQPGWFIHYGTHRVYFSQAPKPIVYFRAFSTNGVVLVMWRTAEEIETKWFDLFQWSGAEWLKVNEEPIPAQNPDGAVYLLVNPMAHWNNNYRFKLVANTPDGEEAWEYEREVTEFNFTALPKPVDGGVELRWRSRIDETYDLLCTRDVGLPLEALATNIPASPPECVYTNVTGETQGYYRLRMAP